MQVRTRVLRTRKIRIKTREQGNKVIKLRQDKTNIIEQSPNGCICNGDKGTRETRMFPGFGRDHYGDR
jgi:hypothetical protein